MVIIVEELTHLPLLREVNFLAVFFDASVSFEADVFYLPVDA